MLTTRLILRDWQESDRQPFYELNSDPKVMEFFPALLNRTQSDELAFEMQNRINKHGWGMWAVEERESKAFIGFVGLNQPKVDLPFNPCVEIGWRLARTHWRKGYATEAGRRALQYAFTELSLHQIVSFTSELNRRSEAVMKRLGMIHSKQNFQHPSVPIHSPLCTHILYAITRERWFRVISQHLTATNA